MNALYMQVVKATQKIAKETGIMWEEEQAEIALTMLKRYQIDEDGENLEQLVHPFDLARINEPY